MTAHRTAIERTISRHGLPATYTRLDVTPITGTVRIANINYQERPASESDFTVQMSMRWVILASDLIALGITRPYEGDRIEIPALEIILTVNRYGPRVVNGEVIAYDLEATGR